MLFYMLTALILNTNEKGVAISRTGNPAKKMEEFYIILTI